MLFAWQLLLAVLILMRIVIKLKIMLLCSVPTNSGAVIGTVNDIVVISNAFVNLLLMLFVLGPSPWRDQVVYLR